MVLPVVGHVRPLADPRTLAVLEEVIDRTAPAADDGPVQPAG